MSLLITNTFGQMTRIANSATSRSSSTTTAPARPANDRGSSDSISLSREARVSQAASSVRSVLEGLGLSMGRSGRSSGTATTPPRETRVSRNSLATRMRQAADLSAGLNPVTAPLVIAGRAANLMRVESGSATPDRSSRLGAFAATSGNERGTTGRAAHNAIGGIYLAFGTFGEDRIGDVFNSRQARELYDQDVSNGSSRRLAEVEHSYWDRQRRAVGSAGGYMGAAFSPAVRDSIQNFLSGI